MAIEPGLVGDVPTTGTVELPPDPRSLEALGRHHTLEAALAELIDNSIDAGAHHALIRFVRNGDSLVRILVADDGAGILENQIDEAMTVGGARRYGSHDIGRFGLGLKAASFSQARSVTVVSQAGGSTPVGRRWRTEQAQKNFRCEIVESGFAAALRNQDWGFPEATTGTVVRWDNVKSFPQYGAAAEVERYLQAAFAKIRAHLGLIFHRILTSDGFHIALDTEDVHDGVLMRNEVIPLDPFGYPRSGAAGWPKRLGTKVGPHRLGLECHIWPGRSQLDQFKLDGSPLERQGLYVYVHDRLVQRGGWNGLIHADKQLALARVCLNVDGDVQGLIRVNPEKDGIDVSAEFGPAVLAARARDGTTFEEYVAEARGSFKDANRRRRERRAMLPVGKGIDPSVRRAFRSEYPERNDDEVHILWVRFEDDSFFEVDRDERTLWLNTRYRRALLAGRRGALNDVPLLKALMFLLTEDIFAGQNLGPKDKDNLDAWQVVLTEAAKAEAP